MGGNGSDFVSQAGEVLPDAGVHDAIKVRLPDNDTSEFLEGPQEGARIVLPVGYP